MSNAMTHIGYYNPISDLPGQTIPVFSGDGDDSNKLYAQEVDSEGKVVSFVRLSASDLEGALLRYTTNKEIQIGSDALISFKIPNIGEKYFSNIGEFAEFLNVIVSEDQLIDSPFVAIGICYNLGNLDREIFFAELCTKSLAVIDFSVAQGWIKGGTMSDKARSYASDFLKKLRNDSADVTRYIEEEDNTITSLTRIHISRKLMSKFANVDPFRPIINEFDVSDLATLKDKEGIFFLSSREVLGIYSSKIDRENLSHLKKSKVRFIEVGWSAFQNEPILALNDGSYYANRYVCSASVKDLRFVIENICIAEEVSDIEEDLRKLEIFGHSV